MTTSPEVKNHLTYLIMPFTYSRPFEQVTSLPFFQLKKMTTEKVYDHIEKLISEEDKRIGKSFSLDHNCRTKVGLPNNKNKPITYKVKHHSFDLIIEDIDLYLFDTQVGFLVYHIRLSDSANSISIEDFILTNYHLKKFYFKHNEMYFYDKKSKDEWMQKPVDFQQISEWLTADISVDAFFDQHSSKLNHSLIYTAAYMEKPEADVDQQMLKYIFYLRKSYKHSYLPAKQELDLEMNEDVYQPFENSYWGVANEGIVNLSYETGHPATDLFFQRDFFQKLESTYFYLYILLLYQKYSLLHMSVKAGEIRQELEGKEYAEKLKVMNQYKFEIVDFTVRGFYQQVSYITHHSEFYDKIKKRLGIPELHEELKSEVDALTSFIEAVASNEQQTREESERKKSERTNFFIQLATLLFLPITTVTGFFGMNIPLISELGDDHFYYSLIVSYMIAGVIFGVYKIRKSRQDRK
ncbi:hypothetical protein GWK91_10485 [Virgibacillus sp. MSP4-1]|uniref:CorA family divalent cation transporter n=1 Tax=Virgibacillus sp. MSP4-1 TaxID=2700081 RepID=UPI0003A392D1|nr:CorA family divalent cation transporter [Virgibacillus sp. MSP4-1]QHS23352.1 hypothetical protein GWK91_10485 [Virgibacillus sp. MSP4-1]